MKTRKSFPLRLNPTLYAELKAWAEQDLRSVNGQIEFLLKQAVAARRKSGIEEQPETSGPDARTPDSAE